MRKGEGRHGSDGLSYKLAGTGTDNNVCTFNFLKTTLFQGFFPEIVQGEYKNKIDTFIEYFLSILDQNFIKLTTLNN